MTVLDPTYHEGAAAHHLAVVEEGSERLGQDALRVALAQAHATLALSLRTRRSWVEVEQKVTAP